MSISVHNSLSQPSPGTPAARPHPIVAFVRLSFPDGIDRRRARSIALEARPLFQGMPGLRSKVFTVCEGAREVVNVYVWESELAARRFFTEPMLALIGERYGVRPTVEFAEIEAVVENT